MLFPFSGVAEAEGRLQEGSSQLSSSAQTFSAMRTLQVSCAFICNSLILFRLSCGGRAIVRVYRRQDDADVPEGLLRGVPHVGKCISYHCFEPGASFDEITNCRISARCLSRSAISC